LSFVVDRDAEIRFLDYFCPDYAEEEDFILDLFVSCCTFDSSGSRDRLIIRSFSTALSVSYCSCTSETRK
jgi:hypothetical protein